LSAENPIQADLLIHAKWILPVVPTGTVLEDHALAIRNKKIIAITASRDAESSISATTNIHLDSHALIPGLVNVHGHAAMSLLRGIADDISLKQWLEQVVWPMESKFVSAEFVRSGANLAIAEMISSGTTCFADMYFFPDQVASAALDANIRVQLASPVLDFPTIWAQDAEEYIYKATQLHDNYRNSELVHTAFGPHAPYTVSDQPLMKISTLAEELDVPIHMHVHETATEVEEAVQADGRRPLQRLAELGLLGPRLICVHATQLIDTEIELLAAHGASVAHCPESNLKLASGLCQVAKLLDAGVNVALGTDGCASNNDLDMFSEMRCAALLAKIVAADASALPAAQALELATINAARALGLDTVIGSLETGKYADITAVNLDRLNTMPLYNPVSQLVYAAQASQVSHVWCGGKLIFENGELKTMDRGLLKESVITWQQKISQA
jgi:5-methylthioadenosine/S-adenosylhomocysteine deaminase|tara:strand:+ start:25948 stop:27279 length:1332 start_codon:yes stop_codon:yes gene_type:complete